MSGKLLVRKKLPGKAYWKVLPIRLLVSFQKAVSLPTFQKALHQWVRRLKLPGKQCGM